MNHTHETQPRQIQKERLPDGETMAHLLRKHSDPEAGCDALEEVANAAGEHDNITAVIVDWTAPMLLNPRTGEKGT